jgi:hypothetical protein
MGSGSAVWGATRGAGWADLRNPPHVLPPPIGVKRECLRNPCPFSPVRRGQGWDEGSRATRSLTQTPLSEARGRSDLVLSGRPANPNMKGGRGTW